VTTPDFASGNAAGGGNGGFGGLLRGFIPGNDPRGGDGMAAGFGAAAPDDGALASTPPARLRGASDIDGHVEYTLPGHMRAVREAIFSAAFLAVTLSPVLAAVPCLPARAQDAPAPDVVLGEIREMALYARYREALEAVNQYLSRADLTAGQRNAGLEVRATVYIAMRDTENARRALEELFARDPGHQLADPDASPPVLSAFGRARANPPPPLEVALIHAPPTFTERRPPILQVDLGVGADAIDELRLRYRQGDDRAFTTVVMNVDEGELATARLPLLDRTESYTVEYYIEALAPSGRSLSSQGTEAEPLSFTVPEAPATVTGGGGGGGVDTPRGEDWTAVGVGVGIGAAVVLAGILITVFVVQDVTGPDDGSLGNIDLPLLRF
jgi:hypothetical protein